MPNVLLVEDNAEIREVLSEALQREGLIVEATGCPMRAIDLIGRGESYRLLITDIDLGDPIYDGFHLAMQARAINGRLPVLFMSGETSNFTARTARPDEIHAEKPFGLISFLDAVRTLLASAPSA